MSIPPASWLVGSRGLFSGRPPSSWARVSARAFPVLSLLRTREACWVGAPGGLWELRGESWLQRHDETLTEVLAVCLTPGRRDQAGGPGIVAGCPYGAAVPSASRGGAWRWSFADGGLSPDERFTSCLLADPDDPALVWAGTEAGLYAMEVAGLRMHRTNLTGTPVRALASAHGALWAGTDTRGVWRREGGSWRPAGTGLAVEPVFSLAEASGGTVLAGTSRGIAAGDGRGSWRIAGPRMLVSALATGEDPDRAGSELWLAGASPGGLWYSTSRGEEWRSIPGHAWVRALASPLAASPGGKV